MARSFNPKKLALWQDRFRRFLDSGLAVSRFCAVEHVSESSFYYWRKKLGPQGLRRFTRAKDRDTRAKDRYTGVEYRYTGAEDCDASAESGAVFRPVTVVPATCGVVVLLPGGTRIEVDADPLEVIRAVVAETVRVDHGWAAERNVTSNPSRTVAVRGYTSDNRSASSGNRNGSSGNQVVRKRGGSVSC